MSETLRPPPFNIEAEQAVLGALMLDAGALLKISDWLLPEDFWRKDHATMYRAIVDLASKSKAYDAVTLGDWAARKHVDEFSPSYCIELANTTPSAANVIGYAEIVKEAARMRSILSAATETATAIYARKATSAEIAGADLISKISKITASTARGGLRSMKAILPKWFERIFERSQVGADVIGLATPWEALNKILHGMRDAELVILAGRPSMGKSVLAGNIAECAALVYQQRGAVFSLEMSEEEWTNRLVSSMTAVPFEFIHTPNEKPENGEHWSQIVAALSRLTEAPIFIDDEAGLSVDQISSRARREHLHAPLRYVIVDHAQIVALPGRENRSAELGHVSRTLKKLAKDLGCVVILLCQLNRQLTQRADKRPALSDLRESGDIEQDADTVLFVHREDYYNPATHLRDVVEVIVGKGRNIKAGAIAYLEQQYSCMRAVDWVGSLPQPKKDKDDDLPTFAKRDAKKAAAADVE